MQLKNLFESIIQDSINADYHIPAIENNTNTLLAIVDEIAVNFARYIQDNPTVFNNGWSMEMVFELYKKQNELCPKRYL